MECLQKLCRKWETIPELPKALRHIMTVTHRQYIYVFGGVDVKGNPSQSVFVYSTNRKAWQTLPDMPQIRKLGTAVVWKDSIYVVGGFEQSCMCYDPVLSQWSILSQCRHQHADGAALVWKDRILVCGGRSREAKSDDGKAYVDATSVIEEYDPQTDTWTVSQIELPQKLFAHFLFSTESDITQGHSVSECKTDIASCRQAFLIGDETIDGLHDVTTSDGKAVAVYVRPGATFSDICQELDRPEIAKGISEVFLVCGLCESVRKQSLGEIKANLVGLVSKANFVCDCLKVSSLLPAAKPNERINQLNDLIQDVCGQLGVTFVDNDNFLLGNNTRAMGLPSKVPRTD